MQAHRLPKGVMDYRNQDTWTPCAGRWGAASMDEAWCRAADVVPNDEICLGLNLLDDASWFRVLTVKAMARGVWLCVGVGDYRQMVFRDAGEKVRVRRRRAKLAA